jgi:chlorobactene glucosyltransferase
MPDLGDIVVHFQRVHIFALAIGIIALLNLFTIRRPTPKLLSREKPLVSVLVPARNEEHNIQKCLRSLFVQDYPRLEILVWDDCSTDRTREILTAIQDERFRWTKGTPPPPGWLGKSWACYNLAQKARGEILIFTDADTWHEPSSLSRLVEVMYHEHLDALSGVAREVTVTWGEKLTVPFMVWSVAALYPHLLSFFFPRSRALAVGNGQLMAFRRSTYWAIDGHQGVRGKVIEDMELARTLRLRGYRYRFYNLTDLLSCRMYHNFREAFQGMVKSYFWVFGGNIIFSSFVWGWLLFYTLYPYYLLLSHRHHSLALLTIGVNAFSWGIVALFYRVTPWVVLFNPAILLINVFIGWTSTVLTRMKRVTWKGRRILTASPPPR